MKKLFILILAHAMVVIIGCQDNESASNNPWTIRAKARIEMQNQPDELEEYFARYEKNFLANERKYYRLDDSLEDPDGNYYAQSEEEDNRDSEEKIY